MSSLKRKSVQLGFLPAIVLSACLAFGAETVVMEFMSGEGENSTKCRMVE